ncbi:MAG: ribosome rescue protein RqcH [Promethearchaeota archaeon]
MNKTKAEFSNFDVFAITKELDEILLNSIIMNIYEIEDLLILKIKTNHGRKNLIIKSDSRINLTEYDYPIPLYPSQYIMSLRKFLKNRRILRVSQYDFDRIVIFELSNPDGESWNFIIELFNKGNFLLLDNNNIIKVAKKYKKFKDRDILANRKYSFPISRGKNFLTINQKEFGDMIKDSDVEIVRVLARNINMAGTYSEDICYMSNVDKRTIGNHLNDKQLKELFKSFKKLRNNLLFSKNNAHIVLDNTGAEISALPFEMEIFKDYKKRFFNSFNEAVDEFFSKIDSKIIKKPKDKKIIQKIKAQEKILKNQLEYLETLKKKKKKYYEQGDFIYANFSSLEKLLGIILDAKTKGYSWEEINEKLQNAKKEKLKGSEFFSQIIPATKQLTIKANKENIYLELNKSIGENANLIFSRGKKAERKIQGNLIAIERTKAKIDDLTQEKDLMEFDINFLIKKPRKKWYEKFRWFKSSEGFLVIGGRDATSNEVIYKKYLTSNDLVLHTNFPGSPLTIIKNPENKEISTKTIQEAAIFVASFSRAWKEAWGVVDVFYVLPEQVSKSPPSGEFLPKGSFIISGKKNSIKNAKTELAIGLKMRNIDSNNSNEHKGFYPSIICGPENAIKKQINGDIILIKPSKTGLTKGKLAKQIKHDFIENSEKELKKWIKLLSLDEIILALPTGLSVKKK